MFPLGYGAWKLGGHGWRHVDHKKAIEAVICACESGIELFDTAPAYGYGKSEEYLGSLLKGHHCHISTKCGLYWDDSQRFYHDLSESAIYRGLEQSLKRLKRDFVDTLFIHWPDSRYSLDSALSILLDLREQKLIKNIGISNYDINEVVHSELSAEIDFYQYEYNYLNSNIIERLGKLMTNKQTLWSYSPLAQGFLSGEIPWDYKTTKKEVRRRNPLYNSEKIRQQVKVFLEREDYLEYAFKFILETPKVSQILVSSVDASHVRENVKIVKNILEVRS
ncbi:aldo/keto reductase [Spirochaeta cellobiosiphila]|uniref:aldo/keto reductase n=1 Tax=Spirochaeta cellobiosiphila TaxID=504483 RepID=UPI0004056DB2|nr:aldo/keto reductase [Spirochaeta cellobiosiphila]